MGSTDLKVSKKLLQKINQSPFMVIVITGGEPLLREYEESLRTLINGLKKKAIIIDTNGTILPSREIIQLFRRKNVMVRVSWDIPNPIEEYKLREFPKGMYRNRTEYLEKKQNLIRKLVRERVTVAIQSVIHGRNYEDNNFRRFHHKLDQLGVDRWDIQRFIPSHQEKKKRYHIEIGLYENAIGKISKEARKLGIRCISKKDRRHNSVFLLVGEGDIYTQSDERPGEKIYLGKIGEISNYFEIVSPADHSMRYLSFPR